MDYNNQLNELINNSDDPYSEAMHIAKLALTAGLRNDGSMNETESRIIRVLLAKCALLDESSDYLTDMDMLMARIDKIYEVTQSFDKRIKVLEGPVSPFDLEAVLGTLESDNCYVAADGKEYQGPLLIIPTTERIESDCYLVDNFQLELDHIGYVECTDPDKSLWTIHYFDTPENAQIERDSRGGNFVDAEE